LPADLRKYLPAVYSGVYETDQIIEAENTLFEGLYGNIEMLSRNQRVLTADERGIEAFERIYGIYADLGVESLEFRRQRLLLRTSSSLPFTEGSLREKLDGIIGVGMYRLSIDYGRYEIKVMSAASNEGWYHEVNAFIGKIKPANMVYVTNPRVYGGIIVREAVSASQAVYNYRLGTSWALGQKPFASKEDMEVYKMPGGLSFYDGMIDSIAAFAANEIDNVLLNDSIEITAFDIKTAEGGEVRVEYSVPPELCEITGIKLRKGGETLIGYAVYIPVAGQVSVTHTIKVSEGQNGEK
jgi:hypothetical protein